MRFRYSILNSSQKEIDSLPRVPLTLYNGNAKIQVVGIIDSAATVSVLPYSLGLALGARWDETAEGVRLTGNLAQIPSQGLVLDAEIRGLARIELVFAWSRSNDVPVLLGQYNFFQHFAITFNRSKFEFEINPKSN